MKQLLLVTVALLFIYNISLLFAVPAIPWPVEKQQPDGTVITVYLKGDEKLNWMESPDGYTLLYSPSKQVVYAQQDEAGDLVPSSITYSPNQLRASDQELTEAGIVKGLRYSDEQVRLKREIWKVEESMLRSGAQKSSATGEKKGLVILAEFTDTKFTHTLERFNNLMNQEGYALNGAKGSVKDYYKEVSYGKLDFTVTVVGPFQVSNKAAYYAEREQSFANEVVTAANNTVNFRDFANENSRVENFHIIFAGYGDEAVGDGQRIWAHAWALSRPLTLDRVTVQNYSCSPELRGSSGTNITHIGVVCHELCHAFGAPDFYDADIEETGGDFIGTGWWDLMAGGSWGGGGATPAHINMYQKIQFGWVTPDTLSSYREVTGMPNSAQNPVAYIIESPIDNDYYILENRQQVGFDADVPGTGLLIYHANVTMTNIYANTVNNGHPQKMYVVDASASDKYPTETVSSYGTINTANATFKGSRSSFTDDTTPAAFYWSTTEAGAVGGKLGKSVTNITEANRLVSFSFMKEPLSLSHSLDGARLTLNWEVRDASKLIGGYKVYLDGVFQQYTTNNFYRKDISLGKTYTCGVSIVYDDGTESPITSVVVDATGSSLDELDKGEVTIYPNPVAAGSGFVVEREESDAPGTLALYDLTGRLIYQETMNSSKQDIQVDLLPGTYLLQVNTNEKRETLKLIVK